VDKLLNLSMVMHVIPAVNTVI